MSIYDVSIFGMLRTKMDWLNDRQQVIASNIANSSTANYKARDLKKLRFEELLHRTEEAKPRTPPAGHRLQVRGGESEYSIEVARDGEMTPDGNSVILEEQMMKVAETQTSFQSAIDIYKRGLDILRMAVRSQ